LTGVPNVAVDIPNWPSKFPLKQTTLELMTTPGQPGHTAQQLEAANDAAREAIAKAPNRTDPLLAPHYPAIRGQNLRGFGWDIDTAYSSSRGMTFGIGSFGHTGFTGTTLWMDPASDTYVILLANAIHPRGNPPITNLRGEVATATAQDLRLTAVRLPTRCEKLGLPHHTGAIPARILPTSARANRTRPVSAPRSAASARARS
jgi:CubicO group peptidase (beta-lactamase class C family)